MAIRKDLDDMLNSLMDGSGSSAGSTPARSHNTPRATRKSKFDNMSVDDLLHALEEEKQHIYDEADVPDDEPPAVWEFAPPSDDAPSSAEEDENVPNIISEVMHTEASTEVTRVFDSIPSAEELPKPVKKKKIVITGELPDYEALRREEMEREKQAQRASEAAAEEAHAAERARRAAEAAAERARLEEEARQRRLAREEAERQQIEQEEAERQRRIAQIEAEKQRRAEEAAEQARLAEEAERTRLAEEAEKARIAEEAEQARLAMEAERARLAEEAKRARLAEEAEQARLAMEAEQQRRIEEMKRLAEEAVPGIARLDNNDIPNESDSTIDALTNATETSPVAEAAIEETAEKPKKMGFFKKLINKAREESEIAEVNIPEGTLSEHDNSEVSATDLIDAAIAAINHPEDESPVSESDPVGNMLDNIREGAAEAIADIGTPEPKQFILTDEDIIAGLSPELKVRFDALDPDKQRQVIDMRRSQMGAIAPPAAEKAPEEDFISEEEFVPEPAIEELSEALAETESVNEIISEQQEEPSIAEAPVENIEKTQNKTESDFENILSENPDELIEQRSEHTEKGPASAFAIPDGRKRLYTILGVVLTAFAVIGIISSIIWAIGCFHSFTSGEVKKDSFTQMIYPAAIMDIEPFNEPSQLTSEQIITATIWSIIMDKDKVSNYELTLDTISIPDVDVEKYAVELFGEKLPEFNHTTVGPVESRFYYADGVYNVKVKTITHTYAPEIKSIVKSGKEYTLTVDYIAELPQWMEKNVAKQAEYKLTEKEDGTFRFNSMKILSVNNGNL